MVDASAAATPLTARSGATAGTRRRRARSSGHARVGARRNESAAINWAPPLWPPPRGAIVAPCRISSVALSTPSRQDEEFIDRRAIHWVRS